MTNFTIEQIVALAQAGFSADQINTFAMGTPTPVQTVPQTQTVQPVQTVPQTQPVQPVQTVPQTQPVQPVQPVQAVPQTQPVQPVQAIPQTQPVQTVPQTQPVQTIPQIPANQAPGGDISGQLLGLIKAIQSQNLANASGQSPSPQTAEDIGLTVLGKTGGEN